MYTKTGMNCFAVVSRTQKRIHIDECDKKVVKFVKGDLKCIDCGKPVFARTGRQRMWHFCHFCEEHENACAQKNGGETVEHYEAKHFISKYIQTCAFAVEKCTSCSRIRCFVANIAGRPVFLHECQAEVEMMIRGTKRVADVGITYPVDGTVIAAIEVCHTHAVEEDKRKELQNKKVAILEVTTEEIKRVVQKVKHKHDNLLVFNTTDMKYHECDECLLEQAYNGELMQQLQYEGWHEDKSYWYYFSVWRFEQERRFHEQLKTEREIEREIDEERQREEQNRRERTYATRDMKKWIQIVHKNKKTKKC